MITSIKFENKLIMLSQMTNDSTFQVLEFSKLQGISDFESAKAVEAINKSGARLRQIRIILDNNGVKLEPGVVSYMKGSILKRNDKHKALNIGKKLISNKFSNDNIDEKPTYEGCGEIFLEPSFQHYVLIELEDEEIIVDDGLFLACEDTISLKLINNVRKNELSIQGSGIVALELPVPAEEIFNCKLFNDTLKVDGDFAILRGGNVTYEVRASAAVSGNGLINIYNGVGDVWLLPTRDVYKDINNNIDGIIEE